MASKEELYVSITPAVYRGGKERMLHIQKGTLLILKYLHNLKVLARQKRDLKTRLHKRLVSTLSDVEAIQNKIPHKRLPKFLEEKEEKTIKPVKRVDSAKEEAIDKELRAIQEKLQVLNAA